MKWAKRIGFGIGALVVLVAVLAGSTYAWLRAGEMEVPDLGAATHADAHIFNDSYRAVIDEARNALVTGRETLSAPAISIAVSVNGELVWAEAQGYADVETQEPVTLASRFTIGSVSKTITATAAAILWEDGALDLDADIHEYLPDYPALPYEVTMRQLLSHQGGIRHYASAMSFPTFSESGLNVQFNSTQEALSIFSEDELEFEPDTDFSYSTYGYTLASAVLEGAAGGDFLSVLQQHVFDPLGMQDTSADFRDRPVPNRVSDYTKLDYLDGILPAPETNSSYKWAGGGLVSTPTDLARFGAALLSGDFISDETREVIFTPRTTRDGEINPQYYGLGWRMGQMYHPRGSEELVTMINHGGTSIGGTAIVILQPEYGIAIAMTANVTPPGGSGPLRTVAAGIARDFMDFIDAQ